MSINLNLYVHILEAVPQILIFSNQTVKNNYRSIKYYQPFMIYLKPKHDCRRLLTVPAVPKQTPSKY